MYRETCTAEDYYERPALLEVRAAAARGAFGVVMVHAVDRLSRDPNHLLIALTELERAGIEVRFAIDSLEETPEGRLVAYVKGYAAQMENRMRKERTLRAKRARVGSGHLLPGNRPLYGYQWDPTNVDRLGRLLKERYIEDPVTAPIVRRIFHEAASGKTLRSIAADLTREGIPTAATYAGQKNGAKAWDHAVVGRMLEHPTYWGEPRAFTTQAIHLTPHERARGGYLHRVVRIIRPRGEQVELPATVAPPLVTREIAAEVARRAQLNRQLASRNNRHPNDTLLHGGFARCAYCGGALTVSGTARRHKDGTSASVYQCKRPLKVKGSCVTFAIKTHLADDGVWDAIRTLLRDPRLIAYELERSRAEPDGAQQTPAQAALAAIDARLADLTRRMQNKRKLAELIEDDDERADLADDLTALRAQQRGMAAEREAALIHTRRAEAQTHALERVQDWATRLGPRVDDLTMRERREVLAALGATVRVWRVGDRDPRVALDLHLPVSGVLPVVDEPDGGKSVCVMTVTGKVQKYLMRQQAIEELGLEAAAGMQTA